MSLKAVQITANQAADLSCGHDAEINQGCGSLLRLLNRRAFTIVSSKIIGFAFHKAMKEWSAAGIIAADINENKLKLQFKLGTECGFGRELPLQYSLPCKHSLYKAFINNVAIPLSLFHPRWLLDGLAVLYER
jgi:hypothetical protein